MKLLLILALVGVFAWLVAGAVDVEHSRAGMLSEREAESADRSGLVRGAGEPFGGDSGGTRPTGVATSRSESVPSRFEGKTAAYWARWGKQQQRNSEARGRTIQRLKRVVGAKFIPSYWVAIASCESGVDWDYNGRSGFDGALQFHPGTWRGYRLPGYPAFAWQASPFQQLVIAELVLARQGWRAWPACSRKLGLR